MKKKTLIKILISLFTLNSLSLYLYLSSTTNFNNNNNNINNNNSHISLFSSSSFSKTKPWPKLPSFKPWQKIPNLPFRSCEAYFGNGYTKLIHILKPTHPTKGWFTCHYSDTLRSSVCEAGMIRMDPGRIFMSRGGEFVESVIGRDEVVELPVFGNGAFSIYGGGNGERVKSVGKEFLDRFVEEGEIERHTMRALIDSVYVVNDTEFSCDQWIEEPVLLVTRFEYANLFHTVTDWYSAYAASRVTGLSKRPHLVFVDGHCETQLEETWRALFSSLTYAKNFNGSVCFRHAILAPLGYETALFKGLEEQINCYGTSAYDLLRKPDDKRTARLSEFGEMIRAAFGFPPNQPRKINQVSGHNILFVRREDYLAHPRHDGKVQTRLSNEEEVFDYVQHWASNYTDCKLDVVNGLFAHMPMKEQVGAIQDAEVIIGAHGAGLTHIVSARPDTVILEIISSEYRRPHFALIALWKGLEYHAIYLDKSYADPQVVIDKLNGIIRSIC